MFKRYFALVALAAWSLCVSCAATASLEAASPNAAIEAEEEVADSAVLAPGPEASRAFGHRSKEQLAQAEPAAPPPPPSAPSEEPPAAPPEPPPSQVDAQLAGPLLIYQAHITMSVFETAQAIDQVEQAARSSGGYLVSRDDTTIVVRVPASKFDGVLAELLKLGDVLSRNVEVRDVTEEYFDLATRLRNQEAVLARLEALLAEATNVEEAIKVETELARVAGEVEVLKGRLKLLRELIAYSTITIEFAPRPQEHIDGAVNLPFPWLEGLGLGNLLSL